MRLLLQAGREVLDGARVVARLAELERGRQRAVGLPRHHPGEGAREQWQMLLLFRRAGHPAQHVGTVGQRAAVAQFGDGCDA
ncbi:hypothetical protein D9M72_604440 [compost metagenome]